MLTPLQARQWDLRKAAHLLNRAGFGGTPDEIKAFCELGFDRAVQTALDGPDDSTQFPKPAWAKPKNMFEMRQNMMLMNPEDRQTLQREMFKAIPPGRRRTHQLVARPDALLRQSLPREDDPLLARPLCHQRAKGSRELSHVAAERDSPPACLRQFRPHGEGHLARPGDARSGSIPARARRITRTKISPAS